MKKRTFLAALFVFAITLLQAQQNAKDYYNPILTGVPSLGINPDAAGGGMADIGTATKPDLNSQFWNSSKYAQAESLGGFAISYTPWLRKIVNDIDLAYLAGYYQISDVAGTLSASLRYFSLGKIELRNSAEQVVADVAKPYEMALDVGYSRKLAEYFSMGVNLRFVASDLSIKAPEYYTGYGFAADVNGFYSLPIEITSGESKFNFGFNISNIGTKISYDKGNTSNFMPTNFRLGISYYLPFDKYNRLAFNFDVDKLLVPSRISKHTDSVNYDVPNYNSEDKKTWSMSDEQYSKIGIMKGIGMSFADSPWGFAGEMKEITFSGGLEYAYNEQFFVRAGYHYEAPQTGNRSYVGLGAGFKWTAFRIDVGYIIAAASTSPLDQTLRFTLAFDVDGLKELTDRR
ncbi:MAG: type IX secretion system outer membrane channel protein PorV [Prevotellaceae bacterium]|jgi:hypothetical protein|nr:type IX secretion system outer membrane channel protein PorV [Prevotellaceae bacterium]